MKVLVCGGRSYPDHKKVIATLNDINEQLGVDLVIQGGAYGADIHAKDWARNMGIACASYHAHWNTLGPSAGPVRNKWMLEFGQPDLVLAFPGGKGTASMCKLAREQGINVRTVQ